MIHRIIRKGRIIHANEDVYEGEWLDDKAKVHN